MADRFPHRFRIADGQGNVLAVLERDGVVHEGDPAKPVQSPEARRTKARAIREAARERPGAPVNFTLLVLADWLEGRGPVTS